MSLLYRPAPSCSSLRCWQCLLGFVLAATIFSLKPALTAHGIEQSLYAAPSRCEVERSGNPWSHFPWARQQEACDYIGYYVGGGAALGCSRERCEHEGTWGWDYTGRHFRRRVQLGWSWMHREQGGTGSYQPDGPRVVESIKHCLEHE